jgi:hypothetical protein
MGESEKKKLCKLTEKKCPEKKFEKYAALVASPGFICTKCGRAAASKKNLCKPKQIGIGPDGQVFS